MKVIIEMEEYENDPITAEEQDKIFEYLEQFGTNVTIRWER